MREKRRSMRKPFKGYLDIDELYNQDTILKNVRTIEVEFFDISKHGVGFTCDEEVPVDYYFNAKLDLGNDTGFYAVLKVIRSERDGDKYVYGCEFVGLADVLSVLIEDYNGAIEEE